MLWRPFLLNQVQLTNKVKLLSFTLDKFEMVVVSQLHQGPLEPAAPWKPALIKYNGSVIVIGNHSKWAPGCGWKKSRERRSRRRRRHVKRNGLGCRKNIWIFLHLSTVCVWLYDLYLWCHWVKTTSEPGAAFACGSFKTTEACCCCCCSPLQEHHCDVWNVFCNHWEANRLAVQRKIESITEK